MCQLGLTGLHFPDSILCVFSGRWAPGVILCPVLSEGPAATPSQPGDPAVTGTEHELSTSCSRCGYKLMPICLGFVKTSQFWVPKSASVTYC